MGNFLFAAFSLRLKKKYDDIKEVKISNRLYESASYRANAQKITKFMLPIVRHAYRTGVDFASVDLGQRLNKQIKADYKITSKQKEKLLLEFVKRLQMAANVHRVKIDNYRLLLKIQGIRLKPADPQRIQIWMEYVNAVKSACNNLIIRAGHLGVEEIYRRF